MKILLLIAFVIFLPWIIFGAKLFFLKGKLNRFCENMKYEIRWIHDPLSTAFFGRMEKICVIKAENKTYHVSLLSARHRLQEYSFTSPHELIIHRKILLKVVGKRRRFAQMESLPLATTFQARAVCLAESVPIGEEKVLLIYPVPKEVTWFSPGKGKRFLGNGDLFWNGYRFFTRSGLLNELSSPGTYLRTIEPWEEE